MKKILGILLLSFFVVTLFLQMIFKTSKLRNKHGDSLLSYLSEEEIKAEIKANKSTYAYLTEDFGEVYLYRDFKEYDRLSFFVKLKDKNYTIYSIAGAISYNDQLKNCFAKQKEIEKQFSSTFVNAKKKKI